MTHTSAPVAQTYALLLKNALDETGKSARSLAKQLAERRGTKLESERRSLRRIMDGKQENLSEEKARQIAEILGRPELGDPPPSKRNERLAELERRVERAEALARGSILGQLAEATPQMFRDHPEEIRRLADSMREVAELLEAGVEEYGDDAPRTD